MDLRGACPLPREIKRILEEKSAAIAACDPLVADLQRKCETID